MPESKDLFIKMMIDRLDANGELHLNAIDAKYLINWITLLNSLSNHLCSDRVKNLIDGVKVSTESQALAIMTRNDR